MVGGASDAATKAAAAAAAGYTPPNAPAAAAAAVSAAGAKAAAGGGVKAAAGAGMGGAKAGGATQKKKQVRKKKPGAGAGAGGAGAGGIAKGGGGAGGGGNKLASGASNASAGPSPAAIAAANTASVAAGRARRDLTIQQQEVLERRDDSAWLWTEEATGSKLYDEWYCHVSSGMTSTGKAALGKSLLMEDDNAADNGDSAIVTENATGLYLADERRILDNALSANYMNKDSISPQAYACLLEQGRRFALELIADAQDYASHADRTSIQSADLLLAAELRDDIAGAGGTVPSTDALLQVAEQVNRQPLPPLPSHCYNGVVLPPPEFQLTARTFDVLSAARTSQKMARGGGAPVMSSSAAAGANAKGRVKRSSLTGSASKSKMSNKRKAPSYGANTSKSKRMVVNLKGPEAAAAATTTQAAAVSAASAVAPGAAAMPMDAAPT